MNFKKISTNDILQMDYNQIISLVRETNRPPGGINSIIEIALRSFLSPEKKILEIGTSTGITALELVRLTGAQVVAIDINSESLAIARERAQEIRVDNKTKFLLQDATDLQFPDEDFDLVFCGNVTSIVNNRNKALMEYRRVLKFGGILAAIPMYYLRIPPDDLVDKVGEAIKVKIKPMYKKDWISFFKTPEMFDYWSQDYEFEYLDNDVVDRFVASILQRPHLKDLTSAAANTLNDVYLNYMRLFRDNLSYMGYSIILLRKEFSSIDPELFTAHRI